MLNNLSINSYDWIHVYSGGSIANDLSKSSICAYAYITNNIVTMFGHVRITNTSPTVSINLDERLIPKTDKHIAAQYIVKSENDTHVSTHSGKITSQGKIIFQGNSNQGSSIFFTSYILNA